MLLATNAVVAIQRPTFNAVTKQSTAPATVSGLGAVPVFIEAIGGRLRAQGFSPKYELQMKWNPGSDIRDGDYIVGWNPTGATKPGVFIVQHAEYHAGILGLDYWLCYLMVGEPAGTAT